MKKTKTALLLLAIVFIGCSKNENKRREPMVRIVNHKNHGNILTDKEGHALYFFANDANGQNSCTGNCEKMWPVFYVENISAGMLNAGLNIEDFKTITTSSGKKQLSYKGWPLYYYSPMIEGGKNEQEKPGVVSGDGVNEVWFVAKPDYSIMMANAQLIGADGKNYIDDYSEGNGKTMYFTNDKGLTLYIFSKDSLDKNKFTKADFSNNSVWPIYETDKITVPSTLDKTKFGSITVFGKKQLTYKGWPLYFFGADNQIRGNNKGVSQPTPGVWPVAANTLPGAPYPGQAK